MNLVARPARRTLLALGTLALAALAGGCNSGRNYVITFKEQPTTLVATDLLGSSMYSDKTALAAAIRKNRPGGYNETRTATAPAATQP
jgi:hypothetical protein